MLNGKRAQFFLTAITPYFSTLISHMIYLTVAKFSAWPASIMSRFFIIVSSK